MKTKIFTLGLICFFIFASIACMSTKAIHLDDRISRPMVHWPLVRIYQTADQVESDYEEVALLAITWFSGEVSSTEGSRYTSGLKGKIRNSMKKKAGKIGANAIILDSESEPAIGVKVGGLGVEMSRKGKAVAIYVYPEKRQMSFRL